MQCQIHVADTADTVARCFPVLRELRPHLTPEGFAEQVARQQSQGFRLAFIESSDEIRGVAGYRILENLAWGHFLYVDDLVTRTGDRGAGFGSVLLDWLVNEARRAGCAQFHLDSGVQRLEAHRFYLHKGLDITSHHFALKL